MSTPHKPTMDTTTSQQDQDAFTDEDCADDDGDSTGTESGSGSASTTTDGATHVISLKRQTGPLDMLPQKKTRQQTKIACLRCQKRKGKCSGERPVCSYCQQRKLDCSWDVRDGSSRRAELSLRLEEASTKSRDLDVLLRILRSGSDEEATLLLARLRLGESIEDIIPSLDLNPEAMSNHRTKDKSNPNKVQKTERNTPTAGTNRLFHSANKSAQLVKDSLTSRSSDTTIELSPRAYSTTSPDLLYNRQQWTNDMLDLAGKSLMAVSGKSSLEDDANKSSWCISSPSSNLENSFLPLLFDRMHEWDDSIQPTYGAADSTVVKQEDHKYGENSEPTNRLMGATIPYRRTSNSCAGRLQVETQDFIAVDPQLSNLFGNLPFSHAVRANYYPEDIQNHQVNNLFIPTWAMKVVNSDWDGISYGALKTFLEESKAMILGGVSPDAIFGVHPYVGALFDESTFKRGPPLSQWAARMVKSIKVKSPDMTQFSSMCIFWYVMRWMIYPSASTWEEVPEFMRPIPHQFFAAHPMLYDFLTWPGLRELSSRSSDLQADTSWILELAQVITCSWHGDPLDALWRNPITGEYDLTPLAKNHFCRIENWYAAPSIRGYISDADTYMNIR